MLKSRLAVGLGFAVTALGGVLLPGVWGAVLFLGLCVVLAVVAVEEFLTMAAEGRGRGLKELTALAAVFFLCAIAVEGVLNAEGFREGVPVLGAALEILTVVGFLLLAYILVFLAPTSILALVSPNPKRDALHALWIAAAGFATVVWPLTFIVRLYFSAGLESGGRVLLVFLLAVTKIGDVAAYAVGSWTARRPGGNHKITPGLSPKKSWEGLIAGVIVSMVTAWLICRVCATHTVWRDLPLPGDRGALILGAVLALLGFAGDLAESVMKRVAGSKDSGRVPGLGGVLDMLDSLVFAAPFFYAWVRITMVLQSRFQGL